MHEQMTDQRETSTGASIPDAIVKNATADRLAATGCMLLGLLLLTHSIARPRLVCDAVARARRPAPSSPVAPETSLCLQLLSAALQRVLLYHKLASVCQHAPNALLLFSRMTSGTL